MFTQHQPDLKEYRQPGRLVTEISRAAEMLFGILALLVFLQVWFLDLLPQNHLRC